MVSELDRELMQNHRFDTALFDELTELQLRSGITHGQRPISPFLRPYFLPASTYQAVRAAARTLSGAFESMTKAALEYPELMDVLGMSEKEQRFARFETGYNSVSVTSRLDTFLEPNGFKFLEYNAETPAGVGDQHILEEIYNRIPEVRSFLAANAHHYPQPQKALLMSLLQAYREWGGSSSMPTVAIVDWKGVDTSGEFEILREFFESRGFPCVICDPTELEYSDSILRRGPFEVNILYKRVIIHEFFEKFDETHPISRAVAEGAVCMVNSFRAKIPHKKASFAVLTDDRYHRLFDDDQLSVIRAHIPWTRRVADGESSFDDGIAELLPFIRANRHRFVLKPNDEYGGKGISFGWECTEAEWDDAIEAALAADHVVQERAEVERTQIPVFSGGEARIESLNVDFDPYLFMGEVEGGMVRLAAGSLVNITQGGGETALAVLEGF
jgi:hypothetical protein